MRIASTVFAVLQFVALPVEGRTIAVDIPVESKEIEQSLRDDGWLRRLLKREDGPRIEIGPGARGNIEILVRRLPVDEVSSVLVAGLPIDLDSGALELDGTVYRDQHLSLAVRLPRAEKRTWLVTGFRADRIAELTGLLVLKEAGARIWGREDPFPFDYLLRETRWLERSGLWQGGAGDEFGIDRAAERNDFHARDDYYGSMKSIAGRAVELRALPDSASNPEVRALARRLDAATEMMAKLIPLELDRPVEVVIERDHSIQGRYLGSIGEAVLAPTGSVHVVFHPQDEYAYLHEIAASLLSRARPDSNLPPLVAEGAALWLSRQWFGRAWQRWLPLLAAARLLPSVDQLLSTERQADGSVPLWAPVAASLVASLKGQTLNEKLAALPDTEATKIHLAQLASLALPLEKSRKPPELPFLSGVSFAMLNRLDGGYHSPIVERRLARLQDLGANAISVMPFAYQPTPDEPSLRYLNESPVSETDVGVLFTARQARDAGMSVLWKPHIWVSHDSWPGEIEMKDEGAWDEWWQTYRRYIAHHALLAEWSGSELFSIGVELGKTLGREREWLQLIETVRLLFSGTVTYSGNWHSDYDRAPFWDRLDAVGVDAYFPLATTEEAAPTVVREGARKVAERLRAAAERIGKPILLTEVGYAARVGAWVEPHREGGSFSVADQAVAYEALFEALGKPSWLVGVFTWKAFTADRGDLDRPDFRFLNRPAEAVVRDYFLPPAETDITGLDQL